MISELPELTNVRKHLEAQINAYSKLVKGHPNHPYYVDVLNRLLKMKELLYNNEVTVSDLEKAIEVARGLQPISQVLSNIVKRLQKGRYY